jgi:ribosomal protein S27E
VATIEQDPVFRVLCPGCGHVRLAAGELRLVTGSRGSYYSFRCPGCDQSVRRPAGDRIVELLTAGGVPSVQVHAG